MEECPILTLIRQNSPDSLLKVFAGGNRQVIAATQSELHLWAEKLRQQFLNYLALDIPEALWDELTSPGLEDGR